MRRTIEFVLAAVLLVLPSFWVAVLWVWVKAPGIGPQMSFATSPFTKGPFWVHVCGPKPRAKSTLIWSESGTLKHSSFLLALDI